VIHLHRPHFGMSDLNEQLLHASLEFRLTRARRSEVASCDVSIAPGVKVGVGFGSSDDHRDPQAREWEIEGGVSILGDGRREAVESSHRGTEASGQRRPHATRCVAAAPPVTRRPIITASSMVPVEH